MALSFEEASGIANIKPQAPIKQVTPPPIQKAPPPVAAPTGNPMLNTIGNVAAGTANNVGRGWNFAHTAPVLGPTVRTAEAGMGKIADILSLPMNILGGALRAGLKQSKAYRASAPKGQIPIVYHVQKEGLGNVLKTYGNAYVEGAKDGIKNKVSPGTYLTEDVMKTKNPIVKAGVGLGVDLVTDPLNLLGFEGVRQAMKLPQLGTKIASLGSKVAELPKVQKAVQFAKETPYLYKPIEAVANPFFRNPELGKVIDNTREVTLQRVNKLYRQIDEARKGLSTAERMRVGNILEGGVSVSQKEDRLRKIASQMEEFARLIGQEGMDAGTLAKSGFDKYTGKYMPHIWADMNSAKTGMATEVPKISGQFNKYRKGAEGYVRDFAPAVFKGLGTQVKDIEAAKMIKEIGAKWGKAVDAATGVVPEGYKLVGEDLNLGKAGNKLLKNIALPQEAVDYLSRNFSTKKNGLLNVYDKAMGIWKAGKTIYNPAYHMRNIPSNQMLSEMSTGKGIVPTVVDYIKAVKAYKGIGNQQYVNEAKDAGLIGRKLFSEHFDSLMNGAFEGGWVNKAKEILKKPADLQQFSEETAKLNVFTEWRKRGLSVADAMKKAEEAIFSPYRINKSERDVLGRMIPFYSFARQAVPYFAKTLVTHPERLTKYPKFERAIQSLSQNDAPNEKYQPDYMKTMTRMPTKNSKGQREYLNLKYFYPWGGVSDTSGIPLGLNINPLVEEYAAQKTGVDPYFKTKFVNDAMPKGEQLKARLDHAATTFLPAAYRSIKGKIIPAIRNRDDYVGRYGDLGKVLLGELTGLKLYPYDEGKSAQSYNQQLQTIQAEATASINRILKDHSKTPEEKRQLIKDYLQRRKERIAELNQ